MVRATGRAENKFCMACFNQKYPVAVNPELDKLVFEAPPLPRRFPRLGRGRLAPSLQRNINSSRRSSMNNNAGQPLGSATEGYAIVPPRRTPVPVASVPVKAAQPATPFIPHLYPDESNLQLCQFLTKEEYERTKILRIVRIVPFFDAFSSENEKYLGIALSKILVRDLRLSRDMSVVGPEDSNRPLHLIDRDSPPSQGVHYHQRRGSPW